MIIEKIIKIYTITSLIAVFSKAIFMDLIIKNVEIILH